jgi:hypothetical protein
MSCIPKEKGHFLGGKWQQTGSSYLIYEFVFLLSGKIILNIVHLRPHFGAELRESR